MAIINDNIVSLSLVIFLLCINLIPLSLCCSKSESSALLRFKSALQDPAGRLSSWSGTDCCSWSSVRCDNLTGHVLRLELRNPHPLSTFDIIRKWSLTGELNPSLLNLKHLTHLDLSRNFFRWTPIPEFIGLFENLRYLNLSRAGFMGAVPIQLGKLTALRWLDLSDYTDSQQFYVTNATRLISGLASLQYLDMSWVSFVTASDWLQALNMLPSLTRVRLSGCQLSSIPFELQYVNFTSLVLLDLSANSISSRIPNWLFKLSNLVYLDFESSKLDGPIPASIGNLTSLEVLVLSGSQNILDGGIPRTLRNLCRLTRLDLSWLKIGPKMNELGKALTGCMRNSLEELNLSGTDLRGYIPDWVWHLKNLKSLDLSRNDFESLIIYPALETPTLSSNKSYEGLGRLVELVYLDISYNDLKGILYEGHFANLAKLEHLDISHTLLLLEFSSSWIPPFQLVMISMASCQVGPRFPAWLWTQSRFDYLDLSSSGISDTMPSWFWNVTSHALYIDLSHNRINGKLPSSFRFNDDGDLSLFLESNSFEGPLPSLPSNALEIDLSNNLLSGSIPSRPSKGETMPSLVYLSLSNNSIIGSIPIFLCRSEKLGGLDLSRNYLWGEIPWCWNNSLLQTLDFSDNNLIGGIPDTISSLILLESLRLRNNSLSGGLTLSLRSCTKMKILDLGYNYFTGEIPTWIGKGLARLKILSLRSNMFIGRIPPQLSRLKELRFLDLSNNNLSGPIPHKFGNFSAMAIPREVGEQERPGYYKEKIILVIKGRELEYSSFLVSFLAIIDLSGNRLSGNIPEEIMDLVGLRSLNLSVNHLTESITTKIGRLRFLESLDLSRNNLSGEIPLSISNLGFLAHLNLSYNNLSGRIPAGYQLQTLQEPSIYIGNRNLCGPPLNVKCEEEDQRVLQGPKIDDGNAGTYVSIGLGYAAGLWLVLGVLLFKGGLRTDYFQITDDILDAICCILVRSHLVISWLLFLSFFVGLAVMWNLVAGAWR